MPANSFASSLTRQKILSGDFPQYMLAILTSQQNFVRARSGAIAGDLLCDDFLVDPEKDILCDCEYVRNV